MYQPLNQITRTHAAVLQRSEAMNRTLADARQTIKHLRQALVVTGIGAAVSLGVSGYVLYRLLIGGMA